MKIKNLFLITAMVCLLSALINVMYAIESFSEKQTVLGILYIVMAIVGMACVVVFIFFGRRNTEYWLSNLKKIKVFCIVSIFCTMLGGLVAVYTYYVLVATSTTAEQFNQPPHKEINGMEIIDDARMAKYIDDTNRLEELRNNGIITGGEYESRKQQIINEYLSKGE